MLREFSTKLRPSHIYDFLDLQIQESGHSNLTLGWRIYIPKEKESTFIKMRYTLRHYWFVFPVAKSQVTLCPSN